MLQQRVGKFMQSARTCRNPGGGEIRPKASRPILKPSDLVGCTGQRGGYFLGSETSAPRISILCKQNTRNAFTGSARIPALILQPIRKCCREALLGFTAM